MVNGEVASFNVTSIVLSPAVSTVEFIYSLDMMMDDGTGNLIVDANGFPTYITFNWTP